MPLSIGFYDGTSVANSNRYNAVSKNNGSGNHMASDDPAPVLFLEIEKGKGTVFEGGVCSHFETYRPIPEPGAPLLVAISGLMVLARRIR